MTEQELQDNVARMARLLGWRVAHFRPAFERGRVRTAVDYDGAGFPDLVLAHAQYGVLFRELKVAGRPLRDHQSQWIIVLARGGSDAGVWREDDWTSGRIERELHGGNLLERIGRESTDE